MHCLQTNQLTNLLTNQSTALPTNRLIHRGRVAYTRLKKVTIFSSKILSHSMSEQVWSRQTSDASAPLVTPSSAPLPPSSPLLLPHHPLTPPLNIPYSLAISEVENTHFRVLKKTRYRQMDRQTDGWTNGRIDQWTNRPTDGPMDGWINGQTNGRTNEWTDPLKEMRGCI